MATLSLLSKSYYIVFVLSLSFIGSFPCLDDQREALLEFKDLLFGELMKDNRHVPWWLRDMEFQFRMLSVGSSGM